MEFQTIFSRVMVAALMTTGCGGAQEEHRGVSRPLEIGTVHSSSTQRDEIDVFEAIRTQWKECINRRAGHWSERSHAIQFDAKANDRGEIVEVKIRDTTLRDDDVVECLRQTIAAVATIALPKKLTPKDECVDKYEACMDTNFARKDGPVRGTSRCAWCQRVCIEKQGVWPSSVKATVGTRSCQYPGWQSP